MDIQETVRSPEQKDQPSILPALYVSIRCSRGPNPARARVARV